MARDILGLALRIKAGLVSINGVLLQLYTDPKTDRKTVVPAEGKDLPPDCRPLSGGELLLRPNSMVLGLAPVDFTIHPVWSGTPEVVGPQYAEVDSQAGYVCLTDTFDEKTRSGNAPISYLHGVSPFFPVLYELLVNEGRIKIGWDQGSGVAA